MEPSLERRRGPGRRRADVQGECRLRGLEIAGSLRSACDGTMGVVPPDGGGTVVRIVLPSRTARQLAVAGTGQDA